MARCHKSDVDTDFEGERRNEVKRYMENKYGQYQVCSVGTYTTLKIKAALKELGRQISIPPTEMNYITTILDLEADTFVELFRNAVQKSVVKKFIHKYPELIDTIPLLLKQPKTSSIHACATLILPDNKTVFEWIPVRKMILGDGEEMIVTEWEGTELEIAGFLKEDILGIQQLDKFQATIKRIKNHHNISIDIGQIPYDDERVFEYFRKGWNSDVFHFGSKGLSGYCKMLQPENINDLVAGIALYRPGAMENNFHNEYVLRSRRAIEKRQGNEEIVFDFGLEEVTKETYGLYIYQESIMQAVQILGGFSLTEADDVRRAMGKKKKALLDSYKNQFISNATNQGCPLEEAEQIWEKLEKFSAYGFNKSHAAAYAITGYISQWFKVNYPIEFWATAFQYVKEKDIAHYIAELNISKDLSICAIDINKSFLDVRTEMSTRTIFWPLTSVKQCGDKAAEQIFQLRDDDGQFFSLEEFLSRNKFKGSKVTKQVIENLIISGAFDEIEAIEYPSQRLRLIQEYRRSSKTKIDLEKDLISLNTDKLTLEWWWLLKQKQLSGIAFWDYKDLCNTYLSGDEETINISDFQLEHFATSSKKVKVGGLLIEFNERSSKKGLWARLVIESNYHFINITIWPEQYKTIKQFELQDKINSLLLISGRITWDSYKNENILTTYEDTEFIILE